ncbi:MAG: OmpA family protein [Bacteroidia bacterium]|nr:OmpA family protein [Bacteroidia bacterium]MDW8346186.1 OmpA family protein [Bacteroidia bacterium]
MNYYSCICLWGLVILPCLIQAQKNNPYTLENLGIKSKKALEYFVEAEHLAQRRVFEQAIPLYLKAIKTEPQFDRAYAGVANSYFYARQDSMAEIWFEKTLSLNEKKYAIFYSVIGDINYQKGNYQKALENYIKYTKSPNADAKTLEKVNFNKKNCEFALKAIKNPTSQAPQNMGTNINTIYNEYYPSLTIDETQLIFTAQRPRNPTASDIKNQEMTKLKMYDEDFYVSTYKDGQWQKAVNLGPPVNTLENEGSCCFSADGKSVYYVICDKIGCDIFVSDYVNKQWSEPRRLNENINTRYWESTPCISADGNTLYFTSSRPGGKGGYDIWKSTKTPDGDWGPAENLGDSINTPYKEISPFIHPDGKTLYFASEGHPGMGSADLFMSRIKPDGTYSTPINLGYPINTPGSEASIIINRKGDVGYYSLKKPAHEGGDVDLYTFQVPDFAKPIKTSYLKATVINAKTKQPIPNATLNLIDLTQNKTILKKNTDEEGNVLTVLPANQFLGVFIEQKGFLTYSENFQITESTADNPQLLTIPLNPVEIGSVTILKNVFFDFNAYQLLPQSYPELDKLAELLNKNSTLKIELSGHTDDIGEDKFNLTLSQNRANAVKEYLLKKGISADRIQAKGYGKTQPLVPNVSEANRKQNRRTECKILSF